ncbi:MAG: flagella basal body P-ring formation protein FlgA [Armatimonadia bacterium]
MPHPLSLLTLLTLTIPAMAAAMPVVALQPQATVDTTEVTLGQVASGLTPELAAVNLGSAPVPGTTRHITADYICLRLRRCGIRPETLDLQGEGVTVCRKGAANATATARPVAAPRADALIRRNQLVEVEVQCGGVTIHTTGRAAADASEGDLIEINLATTNRKVTGRVSRGTILVVIPGSVS